MLITVEPGVYILRERNYFGNQYGIKTQLLCILCLPLFALRLFFPLRTSILQKNICVYHRCARASRAQHYQNF
jgi:hypothetical protein